MKKTLLKLVFFFFCLSTAFAQEKVVRGTILGKEDGLPLPGVSIYLKGSSQGTQTGADGTYSIKVPENGSTLVFSFIGYKTQEVSVANQSQINLSLSTDASSLEEVVVVAYGTSTKEAVTGSVSMVTSKDIEKRPVTNVFSVLEGSSPGIQLNNTAGQPGAEPTIRIRGFTSPNGSNDPLYIIDGAFFGGNISDLNPNDIESISVLKDAASAALYGNRASNGVIIITTKKGSGGAPAINLSVNQGFYNRGIKEYHRLGQRDYMEAMWLGYRNSLRSGSPSTYPTEELANVEASSTLISDYLKLNIFDKPDDQLFDANGKLVDSAQILPGYLGDLDWYEGILRTGHRQDYNLNARTSTDKANLFYSAGYLNEKGYISRSDYSRFTGRINADITQKNWLKYGFNLAGSHQKSGLVSATTDNVSSFTNPFNYARDIAPIYPVYLHDPVTGEYVLDESGNKIFDDGSTTRNQNVGRHTIWENQLNKEFTFRNTLNGQIYTDIKFLKDFTLTLKGDLNIRTSEQHSYDNAIIGDGAGNNGRAKRENYRYKNYTAQQLLNWGKSFGLHNVDVLIGHEHYYYNYNYLYGYKSNQTFAGETELVNFSEITSLTDYQHNYRTESFLSRARYNYDQKYFIDGSFRRDGTSRFKNRWGNFWALGGSWIISEEDFFAPLEDKVDYLKARVSYGEVGNDASADYYAQYDLYLIRQNANTAALTKSQYGNPDLIWETTSSMNAGLEGRLFDRANFTVEYFDKRSQNLLFDLNLPLSAGGTSTSSAEAVITNNIGSISNRGLELAVDVDVIKNKDWRWNLGMNATWMKNKVVRLPEQNRENGIIDGIRKLSEGEGMYEFWLPQFVGVDQMTGNSLYLPNTTDYNVNGSAPDKDAIPAEHLVQIGDQYYTTFTTYAKRDFSGSAIPKVYGSFSTGLSYKNFSLSGLVTYAHGGKTYDYSYASLMSMSGSVGALHADINKSWNGVPEGITETSANRIDPNAIPVIDFFRSDKTNASSSRFVQDGSYLVIKNIALGYRLPQTVIDRVNLNSVTLNLAVENLATFTKLQGMNPQQSFAGSSQNAYVTPRVFSFGLNVGF